MTGMQRELVESGHTDCVRSGKCALAGSTEGEKCESELICILDELRRGRMDTTWILGKRTRRQDVA